MLDVLMLYAIKLGPIETGEGPTTAYVGFTEAGALPPTPASSDRDGLGSLRWNSTPLCGPVSPCDGGRKLP